MSSEVERRIHRLFNSFLNLYGDDYGKFADILLRAYEGNTSGLQPVSRLLVAAAIWEHGGLIEEYYVAELVEDEDAGR